MSWELWLSQTCNTWSSINASTTARNGGKTCLEDLVNWPPPCKLQTLTKHPARQPYLCSRLVVGPHTCSAHVQWLVLDGKALQSLTRGAICDGHLHRQRNNICIYLNLLVFFPVVQQEVVFERPTPYRSIQLATRQALAPLTRLFARNTAQKLQKHCQKHCPCSPEALPYKGWSM